MNSLDIEFCNKEFKFIEYINVCEADLYAAIKIFVSQVHYQGQSKVMFKLPHPLNFNIIIITRPTVLHCQAPLSTRL